MRVERKIVHEGRVWTASPPLRGYFGLRLSKSEKSWCVEMLNGRN